MATLKAEITGNSWADITDALSEIHRLVTEQLCLAGQDRNATGSYSFEISGIDPWDS